MGSDSSSSPNTHAAAISNLASGVLLAPLLTIVDLLWLPLWPVLPGLGAAALWLGRRRSGRLLLALAALLLMLPAVLRIDLDRLDRTTTARARSAAARIDARSRALQNRLLERANRAAQLPEARADLRDGAAISALFAAIERERDSGAARWPVALGVHSTSLVPLAWSGRITRLAPLVAPVPERADLFVVSGAASTTMVAVVPIRDAAGRQLGLATAETALGASTSWLAPDSEEGDPVFADSPGVEVSYRDLRQPAPVIAGDEHSRGIVWALRAPDGDVLGLARVSAFGLERERLDRCRAYRTAAALLLAAILVVWGARSRSTARLAAALTLLRAGLWALALFPLHSATLASRGAEWELVTLAAPLFRSPSEILLSAAWACSIATLWTITVLERAGAGRGMRGAWLGDLLPLPIMAGVFLSVGETVGRFPGEFASVSLLPVSIDQLFLNAAVFLELAAGGLLLSAVMSLGAAPLSPGRHALRLLVYLALVLTAWQYWPRASLGIPIVPALLLLLTPLAAALVRRRATTPLRPAQAVLLVLVACALLQYPAIAHYAEKRLRWRIERAYVPMVLDQPRWREEVLSRSCRQIDVLRPLEAYPSQPAAVTELAFSLWSRTDLARYGFSSAIEVRNASFDALSRFSQNLAWLGAPSHTAPRGGAWEIGPERVTVGSATRAVLHAQRLVSGAQGTLGAIHVYVADDHWNLPFLVERDPYSLVVRRPASDEQDPGQSLLLLTYDWARKPLFSSIERAPTPAPELVARLRQAKGGLWTALTVDGNAHHVFAFSDPNGLFLLGYPRLGPGQFAANVIETAVGLGLLGMLLLLLLLLARSFFGRTTLSLTSLRAQVRGSFLLRLSVAFVAVATLPVLALEVAVRGFVVERLGRQAESQAAERAMVAKKAVEDFALFESGQLPRGLPVTDAALIWVASLVRNDLDLFEQGHLLASSKRELYASRLLPEQVDGRVHRALALDRAPFVFSSERLGRLSFQVVSVPVRLRSSATAILSMPLVSREREMQAVLGDLDRTLRLTLLLCFGVAAGLAHSLARRFSGPIAALTRATRQIAEGDLAVRVTPSSRDELRALVDSFNRMADDLARQREELEQTHRLAAWAEMAREIAHEVKNPLTPIQLSAEHLQRVYGDRSVDFRSTLETCTHTILRQVRALREIVTEFSAFARPAGPQRESIELDTLVSHVVAPYRSALPPGVSLSMATEAAPPVLGDRRLIERAVLNLIENALQAVASSGAIVVSVGPTNDGRGVCVAVSDDGPGLDAAAQRRAFEPFFSTKKAGSGLGLTLVRKTALEHGGDIRLESYSGRGTRAVLTLPASPAGPPTPRTSS